MFVQIKDIAINVNYIRSVYFYDDEIQVFMVGRGLESDSVAYTLSDDEMDAFRRWWEEKAEVCMAL